MSRKDKTPVISVYGSIYSDAELRKEAEKHENPTYIRLRSALIPLAEEHADALCGAAAGNSKVAESWAGAWNCAFHGKMEELVRERRIRELS